METSQLLIQLAYVVAAALFIFGLKLLGSADSARRGNLLSAIGMLLAIVSALLDQGIVESIVMLWNGQSECWSETTCWSL